MSARSEDKRLWLGGGAAVAVVILLLGWFFVVGPQLSAASTARDEAGAARMQNVVLEDTNAKLKTQNDDAAALRAGLAAALAELPYDSGLPEFTRQISAQATANSVALSSIVVSGATPVVGTTATAADPAADSVAAAPASSSLLAIPISLTATGPGSGQLAFLSAIQTTGPRRALVTSVQLTPLTAGDATGGDATRIGGEATGGEASGLALTGGEPQFTLTLELTVFSAPLSPEAQAALEKLLSGN